MLNNFNTEAAWTYHKATKHSYASVRTSPHFLDFQNQPLPFKIYPTLPPSCLPTEMRQTGITALSDIAGSIPYQTKSTPDLASLAQLLYLSAGITRQRKYAGGEIYFRAAACTGALYEVELYLVCGGFNDLEAGVYHFAPAEFGLRQLRAGDYRSILVQATGAEPAIVQAPLIIVCTCTYWRNAWKYQARTYRHFGWDNGTLLANLLAVATAQGLPAKVVCGFVDSTVNRLLDLDSNREVAFSLVAIGHDSGPSAPIAATSPSVSALADIAPLGLETIPLSREEIDYPLMREIHAASSLDTAEEVAAWRGNIALAGAARNTARGAVTGNPPPPFGQVINMSMRPLSDAEIPCDSIEQVILRRGSSRQFERTPITLPQLSTLLDRATRVLPADFLTSNCDGHMESHLNQPYLIVHAVEGLEPGAYVYQRNRGELECLKRGSFRNQAGYLGLEQQLPADAAVDIFFLADLQPILNRFGNRGYRAVQLEAGILGGKLYLAAYAQRLGATGLTFYDDDVIQFFSPHAEGKSAIFLLAVGNKHRAHLGD